MTRMQYFFWVAMSYGLLCVSCFLVVYYQGSLSFKTFAFMDFLSDNTTLESSSPNLTVGHKVTEEMERLLTASNSSSQFNHPGTTSSKDFTARPLLTIFTSLRDTPQKFFIHRNVILNWASFGPKVQPVLFGNMSVDSQLRQLAVAHGWTILPQQRVNSHGTPFLKDMYRLARNLTNSDFYGFCNGDILFNQGLIDTLEGVSTYSSKFNSTLVIGRRYNVNMKENSTELLYDSAIVTRIAKQHGKLYFLSAEDYFFIQRPQLFPWHTIKDVVIGRPAYDNYLVGQAIRGGVSVVDATNTIVAMHQTGKEGNLAGSKNKDGGYNKRIIGSYKYTTGLTSSAQYVTTTDYTGRVFLQKRHFSKPKKPTPAKPKH